MALLCAAKSAETVQGWSTGSHQAGGGWSGAELLRRREPWLKRGSEANRSRAYTPAFPVRLRVPSIDFSLLGERRSLSDCRRSGVFAAVQAAGAPPR